MKIAKKRFEPNRFYEVEVGSIFESKNGTIFLKVENFVCEGVIRNAVNLSGPLTRFYTFYDSDYVIIHPEAELRVNY